MGRARRLATDPEARERRLQALGLARDAATRSKAYGAAEALVAAAEAEAAVLTAGRDEAETEELRTALGAGGTGKGTAGALRGATGAIKDLERRQKSRQTRASRDALDRALIDLATYFRDALLVAASAGAVRRNHPDMAEPIAAMAAHVSARAVAALHRSCAGVPRSAGGQRQAEVRRRRHGRHDRPGAARLASGLGAVTCPAVDSSRPAGHATLAQSVERLTRNEQVRSSILLGGSDSRSSTA